MTATLSAKPEAVLRPEWPAVDPHHHLWNRGGECYDLKAFESEIRAGHPIQASLYVECLNHYLDEGDEAFRCIGETQWLVGELDRATRAGHEPICRGLIARADLRRGARLEQVLEQHRQWAGERLHGFRFCAAWDPSPTLHSHYPCDGEVFDSETTSQGLRAVAQTGLPLDLWVYFHQLPAVDRWLRDQAPTPVVLDHCAGPIGLGPYAGRRAEVFDRWVEGLERFRDLPHVFLKFGGLAMPLAGFGWHRQSPRPDSQALADAWRPYFAAALEIFGPTRVLFESNFPVDRAGCGQIALWNAFKRLCAGLPKGQPEQLLAENAKTVYGLH